MHYGSLIGAYSMISVYRSAGLAIFTSFNGALQDDPYTLNAIVHAAVADIHLAPATTGGRGGPFTDASVCGPRWPVDDPYDEPAPSSRNVSNSEDDFTAALYVGHYEHPVLGELSVHQKDNRLYTEFGRIVFNLTSPPNQKMSTFIATPVDLSWRLTIGSVVIEFSELSSTGSQYDKLSFGAFDSNETVFRRLELQNNAAAAAVSIRTLDLTSTTFISLSLIALYCYN